MDEGEATVDLGMVLIIGSEELPKLIHSADFDGVFVVEGKGTKSAKKEPVEGKGSAGKGAEEEPSKGSKKGRSKEGAKKEPAKGSSKGGTEKGCKGERQRPQKSEKGLEA